MTEHEQAEKDRQMGAYLRGLAQHPDSLTLVLLQNDGKDLSYNVAHQQSDGKVMPQWYYPRLRAFLIASFQELLKDSAVRSSKVGFPEGSAPLDWLADFKKNTGWMI